MKRIWIFGASMSMAWKGYGDGKDGGGATDELIDWITLLKNKLGFDEIINHSGAGNTNLEILWKFINYRDEITKDDFVIFQFIHFTSINIFPFKIGIIDLPFEIIERCGGLDEMMHVYNNTYLRDSWERLFVNWCRKNEIPFICYFTGGEEHTHNQYLEICRSNFIHIPDSQSKFGIFDDWQINCEDQWLSESDKHFNQLGHERFSELIYNQIIEKNIINYE